MLIHLVSLLEKATPSRGLQLQLLQAALVVLVPGLVPSSEASQPLQGLVTVLVDALVKYTSRDCIRPFAPRVLSPSCPDIGMPIVNPVELQADLVQYIMMSLPGAPDSQYFWENALEPCLALLSRDIFDQLGTRGSILDDASSLTPAAHIMMLILFVTVLRLLTHLRYSTWVAKELKGRKSWHQKQEVLNQQRDRVKELEMAVAAVLKMRAKKMWASAMTTAVAKASPQMADKLEPPLQELIKKHVLRKKLAHDVQKCFTPLQESMLAADSAANELLAEEAREKAQATAKKGDQGAQWKP
ncbi:TPA: hypothetical protein ACH3X3_003061 [Trebouxia sp. C0006]